MVIEMEEQNLNRRNFLKAATLTAVAAAATGTGAALLRPQPASPPSAPVSLPLIANTDCDSGAVLAQLASAQADNVRLQAALDAAQRELAALRQNSTNASSQAEALSVELASASNHVSVLSGLLALYEQLEQVDVSAVVQGGISAVSDSLTNLLNGVPGLDEGITISQQALTDLENHIPLVENGRIWLAAQVTKLQTYFNGIQSLLETAVDTVGPFLQMLNTWFQDVLSWLPFGMGDKAAQIAQSITDLLTETPPTISGLTTNIAQPLDVWLARDETQTTVLHKTLITPLRQNLLAKTAETVAHIQTTQTTYQTELVAKVETAVSTRQQIHDLVIQYRQKHQLS